MRYHFLILPCLNDNLIIWRSVFLLGREIRKKGVLSMRVPYLTFPGSSQVCKDIEAGIKRLEEEKKQKMEQEKQEQQKRLKNSEIGRLEESFDKRAELLETKLQASLQQKKIAELTEIINQQNKELESLKSAPEEVNGEAGGEVGGEVA